jgi:YVTN family beta-propeller protein
VSVIDTGADQVVTTVETGRGAHGVVVSDDGSRAFIANTIDGTVSVIDTATQTVTRNIKVGKGSGCILFRSADDRQCTPYNPVEPALIGSDA